MWLGRERFFLQKNGEKASLFKAGMNLQNYIVILYILNQSIKLPRQGMVSIGLKWL